MPQVFKKIIIPILLLLFLSGIAIYVWLPVNNTLPSNQACAFCDPLVIQSHTFYEDNFVRGLCSHKPIMPYHCLIVIKRHIARLEDATENEISAAFKLIQKINMIIQTINGPSSYLLLQKNGTEVGQTVPHVHIHYIPQKQSNAHHTATFGLLWHFIIAPFQSAISPEELALNVEKIKKEFLISNLENRQQKQALLNNSYLP